MKARVNTRFVVALSSVLVVLALVLAVFTWFATRVEPAEYIARGDGLAAQGDFAGAAEAYQRARAARPTDVGLILKHADALSRIPTDNPRGALAVVRQVGNLYRRALELDPTHEQAFAALMDMSMQAGRRLHDEEAWNQMLRVSQAALEARPQFQPARRYRGIAQVQRMRTIDLDEADRQQTRDDLLTSVQANPGDLEATVHLAQWCLLEAQRLDRPGAAPQQAQTLRAEARQWAQAVLERHGDNAAARLEVILILSNLGEQAQAQAMLEALQRELLADPRSVDAVLQVAERLALAEDQVMLPHESGLQPPHLQEAHDLLRAALARHEHNLPLEVAQARVLTLMGKPDEAMALLTPVLTRPLKAPAMDLVRDADLQRTAMAQLADLHIAAAARAADPRPSLLEAQRLIDQVAGVSGSVAAVDLLRGKLELAQGRFAQALVCLDRASAQFKDAHPEALLLSARARAQLGELGAAADRLQRLLSLRPRYVPGRLELASLHLRLGQGELASQQLEEVLKLDPNHREARTLQASALAQRGQLTPAIAAYESLDPKAHPALVMPLARLYEVTRQPEKARALLEQRLDQAPADLPVLCELLALDGAGERHAARLKAAEAAGVPRDLLDALTSLSQGRLPDAQALSQVVAGRYSDPVLAQVARYRLLQQMGKSEAATAALEQARKASPDHPAVIEAVFAEAVARSDWSAAEAAAQRAATFNVDLAQGAFFQGQLDLARGRYAPAVVALRRGLELRPIFSDGWYRLGEALRGSGDAPGAIAAYEKALAQRANHVPARKGLALLADQQGQYAQALEHLRTAVRYDASDRMLVQQYLSYEQAHGDARRALAVRQQIAASDPSDQDNRRGLALLLAQLKQPEPAAQVAAALLKEDPEAAANVLTAAQVDRLAGRSTQAVARIEQYLKTRQPAPTTSDWLLAARFHVSLESYAAAEEAYRQAMAREDRATQPATRELADMLFSRQRFADAASLYRGVWEVGADPAVGLRAAESLLRANQPKAAEQLLADVRSKGGDQDASTWLLEAMIARGRGDSDAALAALDQALQRQPNRALVYLERARVKLENPRLATGATSDLEKAIELDPDQVSARRLLAQTLLAQGDRDGAVRELRALLQRQPRDVAARRQLIELFNSMGTLLPARTLLKEAETLFPGDPQWLRLRAQIAAAEGKNDEALRHLEAAFASQRDAESLVDFVQALLNADQAARALNLLVEQAELVSGSPVLEAMHARALWTSGRTEDGQAVLLRAAGHVGTQAQAAAVLGQVLAATGPDVVGSAVDTLQSAASPEARVMLTLALADTLLDVRRPAEAVDRLTRLQTQLAPDHPQQPALLNRLALAHHQAGHAAAAAKLYRRVLDSQPNDVPVLNNLAFLLAEELDQPAEALTLAQRAAALAPGDAQVLDTLGWTLFKVGQKDQAMTTLRRSVETRRLSYNCYHLAVVLLDRRQRPEAARLLEQAAALARREGDEFLLAKVNQRLKELEPVSEGTPR